MCGILGRVTVRPEASEGEVTRALDAIQHRGPDARAVRSFHGGGARCVFGHTRLRIIDLSPLADQPLSNEDGTVWVAYNGEIYNFRELRSELEAAGHKLRSQTDTDVLVHLYEESGGDPRRMLERLRGMFAFALFDTVRGRLVLARDRLGIKPMYWTEHDGGVAFASEVRALSRAGFAGSEPDPEAIASYLAWGVVRGPGSILSGVHELPPGSFLDWSLSGTKVERWWAPQPCPDPLLARDSERLVRAALADSVSRHLVADRPLGAFLSGGIDSGAVVTLAAREGTVRALTVTFPDARDEGEAAHALAQRVGAQHDRVPVTGAEVAAELPAILSAMDQPTIDGVNTWIVCRATKQAGLVVALSGLGGDELFGGYPSARLVPRLAGLNRFLAPVPAALKEWAARASSERGPGGRLARVLGSQPGYHGAYGAVRGLLAPIELPVLSGAGAGGNSQVAASGHPQDLVMLEEMAHYLPNQLLRDTDQMSMSHSLEIRVPLLDDVLVRVAMVVPAEQRTQAGKALLARAAGIERPNAKRPFALPFGQWMRGPLRETVRQALLSEDLPFAEVVPPAFRHRLWTAFDEGRTHWSRAWAVTVLRLWPEANSFAWR
jgi:asparagine synthase (glutamine-hydrolysing)